jgi:hypothetical protein
MKLLIPNKWLFWSKKLTVKDMFKLFDWPEGTWVRVNGFFYLKDGKLYYDEKGERDE